ncbi:MAG: ATP-binding protein [Bacteroidota bacterium]|nr:ATP-binding protein [Bacteroidota bacterium]
MDTFKYGLAAMAYHQIIFEDEKPVDDIYLDVNDAFSAKTGLQNVIGKSIAELIPDIRKTNPELLERFGRVARTGQPEEYETYIAGLNTWFYNSLYSLGENVVVSVFDNITERKLAEIEIKQRNSELQTLNRIISKTTEVLNLKSRLEFILDEALQIVGLEGGTICLINPDNTFELAAHRETSDETIDDLSNNQIKIGDCLCGNCALDCRPLILNTPEEVLRYATREVLRGEDIHFHAALPFLVEGKCVGVLCVFTRTDKKPTENSLKLLETVCAQAAVSIENARLFEDLNENEELLRLSMELANVAAWEYNFETNKMTRSKNHDKLYGLEIQEKWAFETFVNATHPDDREMSNSNIQNSVAIGGPDEYKFDFRVIYPDQSVHWLNVIGQVVKRDEQGLGILVRGFIIDITERKKAEEEIKILNAELEDRVKTRTAQLESINQELKTFSYSVSHDLKAPLRGIDGYSKLLLELYGKELNEEAQTFIKNIRTGTAQMGQIIEDLLAYSRLERVEIKQTETPLNQFVENIVSLYQKEIDDFGIVVHQNIPEVYIMADINGLTIALRNLFDNAIKFSKGQASPEIIIGFEEHVNNWLIFVSDNGIGFDMIYRDKIFEIFQRLHRVEDYPGTGIGLAMVAKAMQRMGGRVWAESHPDGYREGKGATFYLELPKNK